MPPLLRLKLVVPLSFRPELLALLPLLLPFSYLLLLRLLEPQLILALVLPMLPQLRQGLEPLPLRLLMLLALLFQLQVQSPLAWSQQELVAPL